MSLSPPLRKERKGGSRTNTMIAKTGDETPKADPIQSELLPTFPRLLFSGSRAAKQEAGHPVHERQHPSRGRLQNSAPCLLQRGRSLHHDIGGVHADRSAASAYIQEESAVQGALLPPSRLPGGHSGLLPHHLH